MKTPKVKSESLTRPSLLLRIRDASNQQAWEEFVEIYTPLVFRYCRGRGLQEADAADVSQEVMRTLARRMANFDYDRDRGKFRNWLLTVTRSKLNNFFNRSQRQPYPAGNTTLQAFMDAEPTAEEQTRWDTEYHGRLFQWAAEQLRPTIQETTWQAFWRTTMQEEEPAKVAADLNLSVGAVYVARSRVLARLREKIQSVDESAENLPGK